MSRTKRWRLVEVLERATRSLQSEAEHVSDEVSDEEMVGTTPVMVELYKNIARAARTESTVLIRGETGSGKELVARAIHAASSRAQQPFVPVDCAAIPETLWESELFGSIRGAFTSAEKDRAGIVEQARAGTVFLDEIGEIPPSFQAKLLRFLEAKEYRPVGATAPKTAKARILAATNRPLEAMVESGEFRADLSHRLYVLQIPVPSLRERPQDIPLLAERFLREANRRHGRNAGLEPAAMQSLQAHDWRGNVRELKNAIERAMILEEDPMLRPAYMPFSVAQPHAGVTAFEHTSSPSGGSQPLPGGRWLPPLTIPEGGTSLEEIERTLVELALRDSAGNQTHAARLLDISRDALRYKMKKFGLMHAEEEEGTVAPG